MAYRAVTFSTARELATFLNDNSIVRGAILTVVPNASGHHDLVYDTAYAGLVEKTVNVAAVEDGDEVEITGLVAGQAYEMTLFASTAATTGGAAASRQRAIYEETGAAGVDQRFLESAALVIADTCAYVYSPGLTMIADANGKLYLVYTVAPGAPGDDITEDVTIHLRPII